MKGYKGNRVNDMVQSEMRPRYSSTNGTSAPGSASRPGRSSRSGSDANPRSGTPTSLTNQRDYDRSCGSIGAPKVPAIKRGY